MNFWGVYTFAVVDGLKGTDVNVETNQFCPSLKKSGKQKRAFPSKNGNFFPIFGISFVFSVLTRFVSDADK